MLLDREHFEETHFELKWPLVVFQGELARLLQGVNDSDPLWGQASVDYDECELLLEEAFLFDEPKVEFQGCSTRSSGSVWADGDDRTTKIEWLIAIRENSSYLPTRRNRLPYWSRRNGASRESNRLSLRETARRMADLVVEFEDRGYLAQAFGQYCVDAGKTIGTLGSNPDAEAERLLGRSGIWHIASNWTHYELDDLCDVIEFIHDYVARPMRRSYHSYDNCGYHYSNFRRRLAQQLYRAQVNAVFADSEIDLVLNDDGRFEESAPDAIEPLVESARADLRSGGSQHDELQDAIHTFRRRGASRAEKRMAIVALSGVLENRRSFLKSHLLSGDESALFEIANRYDLRHRKADQKVDYDRDIYYQWIFYWYLATIRMVDEIARRQSITK